MSYNRALRVCGLALLAATSTAGGPRGEATHSPEAARPLPFYYDFHTFRGVHGTTDLVAAFAVPAGSLETESERGRVRYRFDVSLVLHDTARQWLSRTDDSVFVALSERLPEAHLLYTHIEVTTPPSGTTLQRVIMSDATTPGIGQLYNAAQTIRDYGGTALMLSDIALGQPDAQSGWKRGNVTLALLPTGNFTAGAFEVFYEVYNLPTRAAYSTEIVIEDLSERGADGRVSLRFEGEAAPDERGRLQEMRRVQTSLGRGAYRLTVRVTNQATGETASRSRGFQVRDGRSAATMVPALPHADGRP